MSYTNNILSYFIKDIKDTTERAFYRQQNYACGVQIYYKYELLYEIKDWYKIHYLNNYETNIIFKYTFNCKIYYNYTKNKYKKLFYKKDATIQFFSSNYILFYFYQSKYIKKYILEYCINKKHLLATNIKYYNQNKYIYKNVIYYNILPKNKFIITSPMILIPNKYELHYYSKLFHIF